MIDARARRRTGRDPGLAHGAFALVVVMIAVGGLTRLTDSGLSITEWKPGDRGPAADERRGLGQRSSPNTRKSPNSRCRTAGWTLADFKTIYWWEWGHRQLGRVIGLVWAAGSYRFSWAAHGKSLPAGPGGCCCWARLGGLQGAVGWWMVSLGAGGGMTGCGQLPACPASGAGLCDPGLHRLVCVPAGPRGARADAGAARQGGEALQPRAPAGCISPFFRSCSARWSRALMPGAAIRTGR